jgi:hypothetical protein
MVPKNLSEDQKLNREEMCQNVLGKTEEDPDFLNSVVICDETWLFQYNPETKRQSMPWKTTYSPRPKKGTNVKIQDQDNAHRFLRYSRNYYDSVRTTWSNRESDVLHSAFDKVARKNLKKETGDVEEWDNAPAHNALSVQQFLAKKKVLVLHHAPYSLDLAPCDFFLFPKLEHSLNGTHFQSTKDIQRKMTDLLKGFTQNDFQKCFHAWKECMQHCTEAQRNYFGGDTCNIHKLQYNIFYENSLVI